MNRLSTWIREGIGSLERAHTPTIFPSLSEIGTRHYDAIVIGGGAFGITAAYKLKLEGYRVALVEAKTIGSGITSFSTAKVTSLHGTIYSTLVKSHGDATASNYYHMNQRGITLLEEMVVKLSLDCDYDKREHRIWSSDAKEADVILEEYETCRRLGIPCHLLHTSDLIDDLPTTIEPCIALSFPGQSIFNPYKYCQELARHINGDGSNVVENSRVTNVETSLGTPCKVVCSEENTYITGDKVIVATHLPILDRSLHFAYLQPSKSYCVAARIKNNILEEKLSSSEENVSGTNVSRGKNVFHMYMNVGNPTRSFRPTKDGKLLVVAGEATSHGDERSTAYHYEALIEWVNTHFQVEEVTDRWSAMDYMSGDHIPMIGLLYRGSDSIFTATGMSKWGLASGIAGAEVIVDIIQQRGNPYAHMVDARRIDRHQLKGFLQENLHTADHFVRDKFKTAFSTRNILTLKPGEGDVVKIGLRTVGAYRDLDGVYHVVNPICTHLGCSLLFNKGDKVWDCPCHGSQFDVNGEVIHGPAVKPLNKITDIEW